VVFATGLYAPALDGPPQTVVEIRQCAVKICDYYQIQRRAVGAFKFDPQVNNLTGVALIIRK
jgi:hypothetical protein